MSLDAHPLFPAPTSEAVARAARLLKCREAEAMAELCRIRSDAIDRMKSDPFGAGFVPPVWTVVWSLLDWPHWPASLEAAAKERFGVDKWEFMRRMRKACGFRNPERPVRSLWVSGANGSGKTELMAYMANAQMAAAEDQRVYVLTTSETGSVQNGVQEKLFRYIPAPWKHGQKSQTAYVSYKKQTGFAGNSYVFPNSSRLAMKFYGQDPEVEGEGFDADACLADESIPAPWASRLAARVGRRNGFVCFFNTPQQGYTEVVHGFMEGLLVTRWAPGHMLPRDGQGPDLAAAIGLFASEYASLLSAVESHPPLAPSVPESRPEDCWDWVDPSRNLPPWAGAHRALKDAPVAELPNGRRFECVPRVGVDEERGHAVVFFHGSDNPFGYPRNLVKTLSRADTERVKCRLYGVVMPTRTAVFSAFRRDIHVLPASAMPTGGTRYMVMDPAPGRNPFIAWATVLGNRIYVYRELPGPYEIPGVGYPGPWTVTSGRKKGVNDGERGDATKTWGYGHLKFISLIAWLEGWRAFRDWAASLGADADPSDPLRSAWPRTGSGDPIWPDEETVRSWGDPVDPRDTAEPIRARLVDPRGGEAPRVATEGVSTLLGDYEDLGLRVEPAFSGSILSGVEAISSALDYDPRDLSGHGPRLYVSEDCRNIISAMEMWKNVDGEAAACKDPIDCVRYLFSSGCDDTGGPSGETRPRRVMNPYADRGIARPAEPRPTSAFRGFKRRF